MIKTVPLDVAERRRTERSCGDCSLCCKTCHITDLNKPGGEWCPHADPGGAGCTIYDQRPGECRTFECCWRQGMLPDDCKPNKIGVLAVFEPEVATDLEGGPIAGIQLHESFPGAVRANKKAEALLQSLIRAGVPTLIFSDRTARTAELSINGVKFSRPFPVADDGICHAIQGIPGSAMTNLFDLMNVPKEGRRELIDRVKQESRKEMLR